MDKIQFIDPMGKTIYLHASFFEDALIVTDAQQELSGHLIRLIAKTVQKPHFIVQPNAEKLEYYLAQKQDAYFCYQLCAIKNADAWSIKSFEKIDETEKLKEIMFGTPHIYEGP